MQHQHPRTLEASAAAHTSGGASYDGKIAGLYDLEETLGSGHFAVVKLARHVFTGAKVAVKVVDKTKLDEVSKAHLFQEVRYVCTTFPYLNSGTCDAYNKQSTYVYQRCYEKKYLKIKVMR